jgi:hypothetical protein
MTEFPISLRATIAFGDGGNDLARGSGMPDSTCREPAIPVDEGISAAPMR